MRYPRESQDSVPDAVDYASIPEQPEKVVVPSYMVTHVILIKKVGCPYSVSDVTHQCNPGVLEQVPVCQSRISPEVSDVEGSGKLL